MRSSISKTYSTDSAEDNVFLYEVISDLQERLNQIWDKLPIDTIIATLLDPRIKTSLEQIPKREIIKATKLLEQVWSL